MTCNVELQTSSGVWLCGKPVKARGMCNAHLLQEYMGKEASIPRGWSSSVGVRLGGTETEKGGIMVNDSHTASVEEFIAGVTWLKQNDPAIVALKATARELDNNYSNATLNQYRLLLKDIRDGKPKEEPEQPKSKFLQFMESA